MGSDKNKLDRPYNPDKRALISSITTPRPSGVYYQGYSAESTEGVHVRDLWRIVRKRRWLILAISSICVLLVAVEVHRTPSIYCAQTIIELAEESPTLVGGFAPTAEVDPTRTIKARKVIFKSRPVLEDIVEAVRLDQTPNFIGSLRKRSIPEALRDIAYRFSGTFRESRVALPPRQPVEANAAARAERTVEESQRLAPYVEVLKEKLIVDTIDETNILQLTLVLLIDADLRRPTVHRVFRLDNSSGLSEVLARDLNPDELIQKTWAPNLSVLTSGPIPFNPAELISSDTMKQVIANLADPYDHVLIDSPPLVNVTDPVILSTIVDGVILVVHAGRSTCEVVKRARHELSSVGAQIFGVVLNNLDVRREGDAGYSSYKSYDKLGGYGANPRRRSGSDLRG